MNVVFAMTAFETCRSSLVSVIVADVDAFVETIGSLTFDSRVDEFNGLVHRGIVDAGHGLVGFLVTLLSTPLRVETGC